MNLRSALPLGTLLATLAACAPTQAPAPAPAPVAAAPAPTTPAWVNNEDIPDGLAAVGIAQSNPMGDKGLMRTVAIADARTKLAGKLKVRVQNMFSQLNQQVTAATANTGAKPIKTDVMNRVIENVTRQLIDQELVGAVTRNSWTDPSDGSLYMLVVMTKETLNRAMAGAAQAQIKNEIAQGEDSLNAALDKLDAAIADSGNPAK